MLSTLSTLLYFILSLLLLVIVHEFGHFFIARLCGVKVLKFSFGFGKVLFSWQDKKGTEYAYSLVPLGGYVKMLDEAEGPVSAEEKNQAFNRKNFWQKASIVLAGPLFNLIFAFLCLWLLLVIGTYNLAPIVGSVQPQSLAAQAGFAKDDEILSLNGEGVENWPSLIYKLMPLIGSSEELQFKVRSHGLEKELRLKLNDWQISGKTPDPIESLGLNPFIPSIPPIIGEILPESPAKKAGLQVQDKLLQVDGKNLDDWLTLVDYVKKNPGKKIHLKILREHKEKDIELTVGSQEENGQTQGFLGLRSETFNWPKSWLRLEQKSPLEAITPAFSQTLELTRLSFVMIGHLIKGSLNLDQLSGPVGIAKGAGESGRSGLNTYLMFLALISISLGALNLLPIPMLDGGHLLYYCIEFLLRRELPEKVKAWGFYLGGFILASIMVIALSNDMSRLLYKS